MRHTLLATSLPLRTAHRKKLTPVCLALSALLLHGTAALADTATYPGDPLQTIRSIDSSLATPLDSSFGGGINSNSTSGNTVTLNATAPTAATINNVYGAIHNTQDVTNNTVNILNGSVNGSVYGGFTDAGINAMGNTVHISGGTVNGTVDGAFNGTADANNNSVTVSGGSIGNSVHGGRATTGNAHNNTVTMSSGTLTGLFIGGGLSTNGGSANNNTVTISGGTINGNGSYIYGGDSELGSATNNTVTISGNPTFNTNSDPTIGTALQGGKGSVNSIDLRSGNTLNIRTTNITANRIANFANIYFYLPTTTAAGDTVLTLTSTGSTALQPNVAAGADITNTTIGVGIAGGTSALQPGDSVTLIKTSGGDLLTDANTLVNNVSGMQGVSLLYYFTLSQPDSSTLLATLSGSSLNPQTKSLSGSRLPASAFINHGADLTANAGMTNAWSALQASRSAFGALSGGSTRYKTGSHIDVKGFNFLTGAAAVEHNNTGPLMLGGFFEAGNGDYNSYNNFSNVASVYGGGDLRYYGLGILARQTLSNEFYAEGSVRFGRIEHDYSSVIAGNAIDYDLHNPYTGAHLGAGRVIPLTHANWDIYGKYFWSRQAKVQRTILGDVYNFNPINSHRTRLGTSYSHQLKDGLEVKGGLAWEYEFDGKSRVSVHRLPIATPELKGSSVMAELGVKVVPENSKNLSFEAGVQGYAGRRQGVTGSLAVKYKF